MKRQEKTFFVQNLTEELKAAKALVLVDYSGMSVKSQQQLKKKLKEADAKLLVVKNTLLKLSGISAKIPQEAISDSVLTGPTALVVAEKDPIKPLSILSEFAKEHDLPQFKVGVIEGSFQDKEALETLSKLPGKDALYGQVISSISSPVYAFLGTLQGNISKLIFLLKQAGSK